MIPILAGSYEPPYSPCGRMSLPARMAKGPPEPKDCVEGE